MEPGEQHAPLGPLQITEEDLQASAPSVRALLIARYEALWKPVKVRLDQDAGGEIPIDPRLLEIGMRINKEIGLLYRLYRPPTLKPEDEEEELAVGRDTAAAIEASLQEVEIKYRGGSPQP